MASAEHRGQGFCFPPAEHRVYSRSTEGSLAQPSRWPETMQSTACHGGQQGCREQQHCARPRGASPPTFPCNDSLGSLGGPLVCTAAPRSGWKAAMSMSSSDSPTLWGEADRVHCAPSFCEGEVETRTRGLRLDIWNRFTPWLPPE